MMRITLNQLTLFIYTFRNELMFFNRNHRIKTQPRMLGQHEQEVQNNKRRLKIKNIRFSVDHEIPKTTNKSKNLQTNEDSLSEIQRDSNLGHKKISFTEKLPQIFMQNRDQEKQLGKQLRQVSLQYKKKDMLLNSILEILKPNNYSNLNCKAEKPLPQPKLFRQWKIETSNKQYTNQFIEQLPHFNSTKHYRAPKVLESQIMKAKNNPNVVRRKIFSEDKQRQKVQKAQQQEKKPDGDLGKIEIITFSNKFPGLKKDSINLKSPNQ